MTPVAPDGASLESAGTVPPKSVATGTAIITCPDCTAELTTAESSTGRQDCPGCGKSLQFRTWPLLRQNHNAAVAVPDQSTCFFHPEKAFQACCSRCGRFVCALCDLQLGAEHVCPACFDRGRQDLVVQGGQAEWRSSDVLYDSIALTVGWGWIIFWPSIVVALPTVIFLHLRYRKLPRSYVVPRSGWRFWMAYVGFIWVPLLFSLALIPWR